MSAVEPVWQMWAVFAIVAAAIVSYASERYRLESTSIGTLVVLLLLFQLWPLPAPEGGPVDARRLLAGFADPALIALLSLMVVGQGMIRTGALEGLIRRVPVRRLGGPKVVVAVMLGIVVVTSAFFNNTPIVVIFIPVMVLLAKRAGTGPARLLMPLSFVAILGGMITLIGSSTNLLAAGSAAALGFGTIQFFDFAVPGMVLATVGFAYCMLVAPRLLRDRGGMASELVGGDGKQFIAEIAVTDTSGLIGARTKGGLLPALPNMTVRLIQRGEHAFLPPFDALDLDEGDILVVAATRNSLAEALAQRPGLLPADELRAMGDPQLVEAVVAPASRMIGRNLLQIGFHYQTRCLVMGIQRRSRMVRGAMHEIRLEAGDVLLVLGHRDDIEALRASRDLLPLEWSAHDVPTLALAMRARLIFVAVLATVALNLLPVAVAALAGAAAMVATGCLNIYQATRAIDRRVVLLVAAALALGTSLQATGGAAYLAHGLVTGLADASPAVVLSALFLLVALVTNLLSNNATAVLFVPIALGIAAELQVAPAPFVHAVIFAANCSFATPIGYQTNLLVMGPGHYRFRDFLLVGGPLTLVIWIAYSLFAPWYYDL
ncbi:MAG: SLC13 family permease [Alphaproteobacteria bacterium]